MRYQRTFTLGCLFLLLGLTACETPGGGVPVPPPADIPAPKLSPDPADSPSPGPSVEPSPSPTPTPSPSPSPSPTPSPTGKLYNGPDSVEKYVLKFVDDAKIQGIDVLPDMRDPTLQIRISSLNSYGSSVIGLCETSGNLRRVTLDPDFWNSVSETQRELLAHHELGHCVLYRAHRSTVLSSGLYASIMYPIIMGSSAYLNNYDYYQDELFTWAAVQSAESTLAGQETVHICGQ